VELETFRALLAPEGQRLLIEAEQLVATGLPALTALTRLRRVASPTLAAAAWEQATLRRRAGASGKFARAAAMYFTRDALEQATGETIAHYRAGRYAPFGPVADLACGIGGDALPLAAAHLVVAVDRDPLRLAILRENARVHNVAARILPVRADLEQFALPRVDALFCDPGRRGADGRRVFSVADYQPSLAQILRWRAAIPALGVKVSPGIVREEWPAPDQAEVEFISEGGALKEAALWFGPLQRAERRATLLPSGATLAGAGPIIPGPIAPPSRFLYEPDSAILRAGLVDLLAAQLGAAQLDPDIAYLTADDLMSTPFARAYHIEETLPFSLKRLASRLRERDAGEVTVKKRGSPLDTDRLARQLRGRGSRALIVVLTHVQGRPYALICTPVQQ
jgi:SAM-dependent methyltransferase